MAPEEETERSLQGGKESDVMEPRRPESFQMLFVFVNALFPFSGTFSVWLRQIRKFTLVPKYTVTDC